jgi:uncharacterized protein YjbJ (UPF0337 family)
VKQAVGKAVVRKAASQGRRSGVEGKAQVAVGGVKKKVKDGANKAADEINRKL